ncbi:phosphoenolpyruvate--protein phosphotransferase [Bacteroidota bacterium]
MKKKINNKLKGIAAAPGIAIAEAYFYDKEIEEINKEFITDIEEAKNNLTEALAKSKKELMKVFSLAIDKLGEKRAGIFEAQIMILDDPVLLDNIYRRIDEEMRSPEYIVDDEISKYQNLMNASKEAYMKERSQDIEDIKNRIIRNLKKKKWKSQITNDAIVVMHTITSADTILFSRVNVKGYVTDFGGLTSHAAIIARSLNIPAVVGLHDATNKIKNGDTIIVNGFRGEVIINPSQGQLADYKTKIDRLNKFDAELVKLKDEPAVTKDGREIQLLANIDLPEEINLAIDNGAQGVGLVRTEQIFDEYDEFPDEEQQLYVYNRLVDKIYPSPLIIRAFDIGGDKVLPVDVKEPNPFLGWRGIRFLLDNRDLFKTQIKSVLRSSIKKNVKFMLPMIASIAEIRKSKLIIEECRNELRSSGIKFDENMGIGIMIEIPSAAVMAREFSNEVDFVSIGTNDLIQYLLAVDRGNDIVSNQYQEFHPAVIRTLRFIINSAKEGNAFVSMCGEMAADPLAIPLLVGLGLDSISVSASVIPYMKKLIRGLEYSEVKKLADECLNYITEPEINETLHLFFNEKLKEQSQVID